MLSLKGVLFYKHMAFVFYVCYRELAKHPNNFQLLVDY